MSAQHSAINIGRRERDGLKSALDQLLDAEGPPLPIDASQVHGMLMGSAMYAMRDDGSFQLVVAHEDPGHPNWINTAGHHHGTVALRWVRTDAHPELRQLAAVDMQGRTAVHNPTAAPEQSRYWGAMTGRYYCCQGNTLAGREVIVAMAKAYEETKGSLTDRLMAALIAGDCAGGDHRGRLAAGVRVAKRDVDGYWFELYVDKSDDAVIELAKKYAELQHEAKGAWRGAQMPFEHPCETRPNQAAPADSDGK